MCLPALLTAAVAVLSPGYAEPSFSPEARKMVQGVVIPDFSCWKVVTACVSGKPTRDYKSVGFFRDTMGIISASKGFAVATYRERSCTAPVNFRWSESLGIFRRERNQIVVRVPLDNLDLRESLGIPSGGTLLLVLERENP
jgi:hypothetical protein